MRELQHVRQVPGEWRRRWFTDDFFDLIVWYENDGITGFQLCYDNQHNPRAFTWTKSHGQRHDGIDVGDVPGFGHKQTPILVADGLFNVDEIWDKFIEASKALPQEIVAVVRQRLRPGTEI
jgi:hypothetical protein